MRQLAGRGGMLLRQPGGVCGVAGMSGGVAGVCGVAGVAGMSGGVVGVVDQQARGARLLLGAALYPLYHQQVVYASKMKNPSPLRQHRNYYDVLKLTPKATQAQVKNAYYDLSKKYHPDQYKGEEDPAKKFREIKEAYEVLGNFSQRKMYDRGLLGMSTAATPSEAEEYTSNFYATRRKRSEVPTASGRTPIYNFDEWSKLHYESSRTRRVKAKINYEDLLKERTTAEEKKKGQSLIGVVLLWVIISVIYCYSSPNYDVGKDISK